MPDKNKWLLIDPNSGFTPQQVGTQPAFTEETSTGVPVETWPKGVAGSVKAQAAGQLHGLSSVLGAPVDIISAGLNKIGLGSEEPLFGSKSIRRMMDMPGQAAEAVVNLFGGEGAANRYGLGGHATYQDINEVPEHLRANARAGEVLGETTGSILPLGAAARTASQAERVAAAATPTGSAIKDLWRQLMVNPMKGQMAPALGAAGGAFMAETVAPGSPTAQTIAQLGGGLAGAGLGTATEAVTGAGRRVMAPLRTATKEGREASIARSVGKELVKTGESPEALIRQAQERPVVPGATPAERTGSPTLMAMERRLAQNDPDLANRIQQRNTQFRNNIDAAINAAFVPGERQAMTRAAQGFENELDTYVTEAENAARAAAQPLAAPPAAEREAINVNARQILETALRNARETENRLWSEVPRETPTQATRAVAAFRHERREMLPEAHFPTVIHRVMQRLQETPASSVGELQNLRSELLNQARIARSTSDFNMARRLENVAAGTLQDMEAAGGTSQLARAFSRALNDRFSRSYAGTVLGLRETGAPAVRPGLTLETAVSGKPQTAAQRLRELQEAATAIPQQIDPTTGRIVPPTELSPEMRQVQEEFLHSLSSRIVDPSTGRVNPERTANFLRDYSPVLAQFPYYQQQLDNALTAELGARAVAGIVKDTEKQAFSRVLSAGEVPMQAVAASLGTATPVRDFGELARLAHQAGPDAVGGLRAAILDFVMDRSLQKGVLSYSKARDTLLTPLYADGPSLMALLQSNDIVTPRQGETIISRINAGVAHDRAQASPIRVDTVGDEAGQVIRMGARVLGAKLASHLGFTHGGAGPSMQVANIAASAAEQALAKAPLGRARQTLIDAMAADTPDKLINILEKISPSAGATDASNTRYIIPLLRSLYPRTESKIRWQSDEDRERLQPKSHPSIAGKGSKLTSPPSLEKLIQ